MLSKGDLPVIDVPERVEALAEDLGFVGRDLQETTESVYSAWSPIGVYYSAPESEIVTTAMDEPRMLARDFNADVGTIKGALNTYAEELRGFRERKRQLEADIATSWDKWAHAEKLHAEASWYEFFDKADADRAEVEAGNYEREVLNGMAQLASDIARAQNTCANAIIAIYGGQPFKFAGEADVNYSRINGADADAIVDAVRSGDLDWSRPQAWGNLDAGAEGVLPGAWQATTGFFTLVGDLTGLNGEDAAAASRSGMGQFLGDAWHYPLPWAVSTDRQALAQERMHQMFSSEWNSMKNDPGHAIGSFIPDLVFGAGAGAAVARGVRTGLKMGGGATGLTRKLGNINLPTIRWEPNYALAGGMGNIGGRFVTDKVTVNDLLGKQMMMASDGRGGGTPSTATINVASGDRPVQRTTVGGNAADFTLENGRTTSVTARLDEVYDRPPRTSADAAVAKDTRALGLPNDDAGHLIGHRFLPGAGQANYIPQNLNFNRSAYLTMENEWADWIKLGYTVEPHIQLTPAGQARPDNLVVTYKVIDPTTGKTIWSQPRTDFANTSGQVFERLYLDDMRALIERRRHP